LNSYRNNQKHFLTSKQVVLNTIAKMWRPMLYTSLLLLTGFMILTLSVFQSISVMGGLVSIALFIALIADLLLLPAILLYFKK
jgi:hypothetical protein